VYRGPSATSEPESLNVQWIFQQYPAIWCFVDVHSYSGQVLFPWGDDLDQTVDPSMNYANPAYDGKRGNFGRTYREYIAPDALAWFQATGVAMAEAIYSVRGSIYAVESSSQSWPISGAFDDTAYSSPAGVRSFTLETGKTFQPDWPEAEGVIQETIAGLLQLCLSCLDLSECPVLQSKIADLNDQIAALEDLLTGDPHHDGPIKLKIFELQQKVREVQAQAASLGCDL
jgi:hypothetical protein